MAHEQERAVRGAGGGPRAPMAPVRREAGPFPPALCGQALRRVACDVLREHAVDGSSPLVGEERPGRALAVWSGALGPGLLGRRVVREQAPRRF